MKYFLDGFMEKSVIIIGLGELGGVFARGFLRKGIAVYPVTRGMDFSEAATAYPDPALVLLAVAEKDFVSSLEQMPPAWKQKLVLLQNELLPSSWEAHGISSPTVISVWFEKKKGTDVTILLPSPVFGTQSEFIKKSLNSLDIPVDILGSQEELVDALVLKNVFVYTINIAGLQVAGTTEDLRYKNWSLAELIFDEILLLQEKLSMRQCNREKLLENFRRALMADPGHKCRGRSAANRLENALKQARELGVNVPVLSEIGAH